MASLFSDLLTKSTPADLQKGSQEAIDWFRKQALQVSRVDKRQILNTKMPFRRLQALSENSVGKMYMFVYDAKMKDILPYFDTFPLIFPIEFYGDSFLGINLHYLPPVARAKLMDALYSLINNKKYDKTTVIKLSYQILKNAARFKYFQPCIKKYLMSHVGSPFIYIAPDEWDFALMLPTERFQGANKQRVFKDSMSMVR
jgi:hypothetical protein